jgi:hypothetical protein
VCNLKEKREQPDRADQVAVLIVDVWWAHFSESTLKRLAEMNVFPVFIEPNLTAQLSPLDAKDGLNRRLKGIVRNYVNERFIDDVMKPLGIQLEWYDEEDVAEKEAEVYE